MRSFCHGHTGPLAGWVDGPASRRAATRGGWNWRADGNWRTDGRRPGVPPFRPPRLRGNADAAVSWTLFPGCPRLLGPVFPTSAFPGRPRLLDSCVSGLRCFLDFGELARFEVKGGEAAVVVLDNHRRMALVVGMFVIPVLRLVRELLSAGLDVRRRR